MIYYVTLIRDGDLVIDEKITLKGGIENVMSPFDEGNPKKLKTDEEFRYVYTILKFVSLTTLETFNEF